MLESFRARMKARYHVARTRETNFLMSFNIPKLNNRLTILLVVFVALNGLDVMTTLVAINAGPAFMELNPIASGLFRLSFLGFVAALALKYAPLLPLAYATFLSDPGKRPIAFRVVKVSVLVALVAADIFYFAVVGSNVRTLVAYYILAGPA